MPNCNNLNVIFEDKTVVVCSKCLRHPTYDCPYDLSSYYCQFTQKIIYDDVDNRIKGYMWSCTSCKFNVPNPVISICAENSCDCGCPDLMPMKVMPKQVSRINKYCFFIQHPHCRKSSICQFCYVKKSNDIFTQFPFVCRASGYYDELEFFASTDIIHRFYFPFGL